MGGEAGNKAFAPTLTFRSNFATMLRLACQDQLCLDLHKQPVTANVSSDP